MFYFTYDTGYFLVIREFTDSYDVEIVETFPFYDVERIVEWCMFANIKYPYEINKYVLKVFKNIPDNIDYLDNESILDLFDQNVKKNNIKLYCKENKK